MGKLITRILSLFTIVLLTGIYVTPLYFGWIGPQNQVDSIDAFPRLDFDLPLGFYQLPGNDELGFVIEQGGKIKVFTNERFTTDSSIFLDVSDRVFVSSEDGFVGLAFHPDFDENGKVYTFWMEHHRLRYGIDCATCESSIVSEFTLRNDKFALNMSSQRILLEVNNTNTFHHSGQLSFDSHGYLMIHIGDDTRRLPAQDLSNFYGKILRVDVDNYNSTNTYGIPSDNPFVDIKGAKGEIWAYGLRNPWRGSYDEITDSYWVGDVGEDYYEEIDVIQKGHNYGWPYLEGDNCFVIDPCFPENFTSPIISYEHLRGTPLSDSSDIPKGNAVIGGQVYHGDELRGLEDTFIFGDYTGSIWSLSYTNDYELKSVEFIHKIRDFSVSISKSNDGELYIAGIYRGIIFKLIRLSLFDFILATVLYLVLIVLIVKKLIATFYFQFEIGKERILGDH